MKRQTELLAEVERLIFIVAIVALITLVATYFVVSSIQNIPPGILEFLKSILTNLIPVPFLFILSFVIYRRIQSIRHKNDTEKLSELLVEDVVKKLREPTTKIGHLLKIEEILSKFDIETMSQLLKEAHYAGIVAVHQSLYDKDFEKLIGRSKKVTILNTWIPNLDFLADALVDALSKKNTVQILMLYPNSGIATLRSEALHRFGTSKFQENQVRSGVEHCLDVLSDIAERVDEENRKYLQIKLYNAMPSISVYNVDEHFFVSLFFHGQLAIKAPQIEVQSETSILGKSVSREVAMLWSIGQEFSDVRNWRTEISIMADKF
ncbi:MULTISPECIES: hypothetical protein [Nostocales]|jgi:hypothetical protein|uniref:Uncharacterized protein n=1 Tax=Dolichospermum flos-aquae UHCC 0037 TaxID=2590026 RepID=A0ACC7SAF4_DOLFA|nr:MULTISPECIES: hypothetical protein [Nostocales]MBO1052650.1 hypothetical protein [Dolichospermum sp. DET73]ALB42428.1 hypothetical protein AA650_19935 [Anabaena sp. WA102]MTJ23677.1 hypothetical protein [Dolichospermum sp. UHCC 0352]MTJ45176.1 hypothetical protein [Dolichospermum flos-aquae UHCC 0037]OBQ23265.1 MAG: hypothetical protein AN486_00230 [Anabaena sp. AL93]